LKTICIAGKNDIAVDILEYCLKEFNTCRITCSVCRNETGVNSWQKSLKWFAEKWGVEIITLQQAYEIEDLLFISTEFDRIIKPEKFKTTDLYNIHFSMLPKYKGCAPSVLPILFGDGSTGVTLHRMRAGIDTGEIIEQRVLPIEGDCSLDLYGKLEKLGTEIVTENIPRLLSGDFECTPQSKEGSTYFDINYIDYKNLELITNRTACQIRNQIRAFAFRPYQLLKWNGCGYVDGTITDDVSVQKPGTILEENGVYTKIATIDYDLIMYKDTLEAIFDAIREKDNDTAQRLCASNKIVNAKDEHGWSPLIVAVYNNNLEMVEYLINRGADINVKNINGTNLLMYAKNCYVNSGDSSIFELLISKGLSPESKDYIGKSLLDYCAEEHIEKIGSYILN
jgi:methionyl-tRNA formyltransferase